MREELKQFAEAMEAKLKSKDHLFPNGWAEDTTLSLLKKLDDKLDDLWERVDSKEEEAKKEIHDLAVSIANFCMMVADKTKGDK